MITENIWKHTEKPLGDHQRCQNTTKNKMDSKQNNLQKEQRYQKSSVCGWKLSTLVCHLHDPRVVG